MWDARIRLRAGDATSGREHLAIAELCLDAGRQQEARKWIEDGLWKAEDRPEHGLESTAAKLYRRLGEPAKAQALLWNAFQRMPSLALHQEMLEDVAEPAETIDRNVSFLERQIGLAERRQWSPSTLAVELLRCACRLDEAWAIVELHGCGQSTLEDLVRASEESHPEKAIQTHARLIDAALVYANQSNYPGVVARIARMEKISARIGQLEAHGAYVADLALKHKAKRTFIRLLNDSAPWPDG
jgi:hypothetical protein